MRSIAIPAILLTLATPVSASVFTVTKTADTLDGACDPYDCSLREAVAAANLTPGTDVVELPPGTYVLTRTGAGEDNAATGDLDVKDPLILVGTDAAGTVLDGNAADRVLDISAETEIFGVTVRNGLVSGPGGGILVHRTKLDYLVVIRRSVVADNHAAGSGGDGGGVQSDTYSPVVVLESTVSGNRADAKGGGLAAIGFWLIDSTVSGNSAGQFGGGLYYRADFSPPIQGSTITANAAGQEGGGIYVETVPWVVEETDGFKGSILAGNTAPANPDCIRADSGGYNVIGIADGCGDSNLDRKGSETAPLDPGLAPLHAQETLGGPTPVHALLPGSPALDLVPAEACLPHDQLGRARSVSCEAGAVEQPLQPVCTPGGPVLCLKDGRFKVTALWSGNGTGGAATAAPLTGDTGNFWFFSPQNLELTVKILDGCTVNDRFWVFTSGLTNRGVDLRVEDLWTGLVWSNRHPSGTTNYATRLDTSALDVCHPPGVPAGSGDPGTLAIDPVSAVFVVTKGFDTLNAGCGHDCSLREAVAASNNRPGSEVILLGERVHTLTRAGRGEDENAAGDLDVLGPLVILGAGAGRSVIDGGAVDRIFEANEAHSRLEIHGATLRNGRAEAVQFRDGGSGGAVFGDLTLVAAHVTGNRAAGAGGGIYSSHLVVRDSTISGNEAVDGGGIDTFGIVRLSNVTVSGNRAQAFGGGLHLFAFDQELDGVTITGNSAGLRAGGVLVITETCPSSDPGCRTDFAVRRSIIAGNQAPRFRDCLGLHPLLNTYNVFGVDEDNGCVSGAADIAGTVAKPLDPRLTPLGDHGGPTPTHALLADSPAIDFAPVAGCLAADQRGRTRPAGNGCDSGAVERLPACQPGATTLCLGDGDRFRATALWAARGDEGEARAIPLTLDTGSFWFFSPANVELTLKILDGCAVNDRFWVFVSGLTDVDVDVSVEDTLTGRTWTHSNPAGVPFQPRLDTNALDICPEAP